MNEALPELGENPVPDSTWAAMRKIRARVLSDNGRKAVDPDVLDESMQPFGVVPEWGIIPEVCYLTDGDSPVTMWLTAVGLDGQEIDSNKRFLLADLLKEISPEQPFSNPTIPSDSIIGFRAAVAIAEEEIYESFERAKEVLGIVGLELDDLRWPVFS